MKAEDRKAAIAAFKERKAAAGVYAVRCAATGQTWVGTATNLGAIWNRLTFMLRQGAHANPALQAAWRDHGAEAFALEELERLDAEATLPHERDRTLRGRLDHWRAALGVEAV